MQALTAAGHRYHGPGVYDGAALSESTAKDLPATPREDFVRSLHLNNVFVHFSAGNQYGTALALGGSILIMNKHYLRSEKKQFTFVSARGVEHVTVLSLDSYVPVFRASQPTDLVLIAVPSINCKQRLHSFLSDEALRNLMSIPSAISKCSVVCGAAKSSDNQYFPIVKHLPSVEKVASYVMMDGHFSTRDVGMYDTDSYPGMCGSIVINNNHNKILGIHFAGTVGVQGACQFISYGDLKSAMDVYKSKFPSQFTIPRLTSDNPQSPPLLDLQSHFELAETIPRGVYQSSKHGDVPSPIHGVFPVTRAPTVKCSNDPRCSVPGSPLARGLLKFIGPAPYSGGR